MQITIDTPNSPGTQFNENTDECLYKIFRFLDEKNERYVETFKKFREHASKFSTKDNYIRSLFPFLKNAKIITDYNAGVSKNLFSDLGIAYCLCIDSIKKLKLDHQKNGLYNFTSIKQMIVRKGINNIIQNQDVPYGKIFKKILEHLLMFQKINEQEFALVLGILQNKIDEQKYEAIMSDPNREIKFFVNVTNKGTRDVKKLDKITCFTYFMGSLESAGILCEENGAYIQTCTPKEIKEML